MTAVNLVLQLFIVISWFSVCQWNCKKKKGEEVKQKIKEKQTMENKRQVGETVQAEVRTVKESLRAVAGFD